MNVWLLGAVALFFFGMGAAALFSPAFVVGFFGLVPDRADSRSEVRAVYGGFGIAVAALLFWSPHLPQFQAGIVLAVAVALLGMALGRVISVFCEKPLVKPGRWPLVFFGVELVLAALLSMALVQSLGHF